MELNQDQMNKIIENIIKIEELMIFYVIVKNDSDKELKLIANTYKKSLTIKNNSYIYKIDNDKELDLGVAETTITTRKEIKQKKQELRQQLTINLIKKLIQEDGVLLLFRETTLDEDSKLVYKLYRERILKRLYDLTLPQKSSKSREGCTFPLLPLTPYDIFSYKAQTYELMFASIILVIFTPLITITTDLEDIYQSIKIKQYFAAAAKLLAFSILIIGAAILIAANPIGGTWAFVFLSVCALDAVAVLFRLTKYLINCVDAPDAYLRVPEQKQPLTKAEDQECANTFKAVIDTLADKDKNLYGPEAESLAPFWNIKNQEQHRNILNMVTKFKSKSKIDNEDILDAALVASHSILIM